MECVQEIPTSTSMYPPLAPTRHNLHNIAHRGSEGLPCSPSPMCPSWGRKKECMLSWGLTPGKGKGSTFRLQTVPSTSGLGV